MWKGKIKGKPFSLKLPWSRYFIRATETKLKTQAGGLFKAVVVYIVSFRLVKDTGRGPVSKNKPTESFKKKFIFSNVCHINFFPLMKYLAQMSYKDSLFSFLCWDIKVQE